MTMTSRRKFHLSLSGLSIAFALGLALWEWYFFFVAGTEHMGNVEGRLGFFTPNRLGFNLAWLVAVYLTYQLISIPFALPAAKGRFIGVVDGIYKGQAQCRSKRTHCRSGWRKLWPFQRLGSTGAPHLARLAFLAVSTSLSVRPCRTTTTPTMCGGFSTLWSGRSPVRSRWIGR